MIATLSPLFDDIDPACFLEVIQNCFKIFLGRAIPASDSVKPDVGNVKGNAVGVRTVVVDGISVSSSQSFLLFFRACC